MQLKSIKVATVVVSLAGLLPLLWVWQLPVMVWLRLAPFLLGPSIILAFLGYKATEPTIPVLLLGGAVLLTAMWIWITYVIFTAPHDRQSFLGMALGMITIVQWFIVALAILAFVLRRMGFK